MPDHFIGDRVRYTVSWVEDLQPESPSYPALAKECIASSAWALASDSPATDVVFTDEGYDADLRVAWVTLGLGASLNEGDKVYIKNTIETTGLLASGALNQDTSSQTLSKTQIICIRDC